MDKNRMPGMTLAAIAQACGGEYIGDEQAKEIEICGAVIDSRQVEEGFLFFAIPGERVDGHQFIPHVFANGAAVVSEQRLVEPQGPYILVESTTEALKQIAAFYRDLLGIKVVGITGSVGKTSTKEMISSVLSQKYEVLHTEGNFNNEIGLPLTVLRIREHHQVAVLEMGISDFGEMHRLANIARPNLMVITNIGLCHLENLGTREGILNAKTECFEHLMPDGQVILNGDDDQLCKKKEVLGKPVDFYGIGKDGCADKSIYAKDVENLGFEGMKEKISTPQGELEALIHIPGEHNVYNALAATAVGLRMGLTLEEIEAGIACAKTIAGRNNVLSIGGMTVIDDCYNANPVSMKASLETLSRAKGRSIAVLGDMGELGLDERQLHREVGIFLGQQNITTLFATGTLAEEYVKGVKEVNSSCEIHYFADKENMTAALLAYMRPEDTILVKASHFMEFPKIIQSLQVYVERV